MQIKIELRRSFKAIRKAVDNKSACSHSIAQALFDTEPYKSAKLVLCYSSFGDEVSTDYIIDRSLKAGKRVALPYCVDKNGAMEFYEITCPDDLIKGSFGISEPDTTLCPKIKSFDNSIIIVPALAFDKRGYRLGYGKGYYDRFLEKYSLISIGLCYNMLMVDELPVDKYDKSVNYVITENAVYTCR